MSEEKKEVNPNAGSEESIIKPEEKEKDPLEGKSIDELIKIIIDLEKREEESKKKLNQFAVIVQTIIIKLKETGLDLQVIGRNAESMFAENPRKPN